MGSKDIKSSSSKKSYVEKVETILKHITVEPLLFLDGLSYSIMSVFVEDLQMRRICEVALHQNSSTCSNLGNHSDISSEVQVNFSVFAFYDGIIKSAIPLFFILFMGAWSDKYGRKVPLCTAQIGHFFNFLGLLLFSLMKDWPVEYMLIPSFLDSLGGGNVCFLTAANAYISDITSESSRTSRVGIANSIFFLGGPIGTFTGKFINDYGGYPAIFGTSLTLNIISLIYVTFFIEESHGPYASKDIQRSDKKQTLSLRESLAKLYGIESKKQQNCLELEKETISIGKMIRDFFNPQRIIDSVKCTLKKREGNTRTLIMMVIFCSLLRRLTRSPYVFAFSRHVLFWEAGDYSLWVTFKNLMATVGSLVAVPLLSGHLHLSDYLLGMIGAFSGMFEYLCYGIVVFIGEFFFWIAPIFAILINACTIAQRAMLSKFVSADELGKVSAVLGALDGIMPMTNFALFMAVYRQTVTTFPAAHFFLAASCSALMVLVFGLIMSMDRTHQYDIENVKLGPMPSSNGPIISKNFLVRNDSRWLSTDYVSMSISSSFFEDHKPLPGEIARNPLDNVGPFGKHPHISPFTSVVLPPLQETLKESDDDRSSIEDKKEETEDCDSVQTTQTVEAQTQENTKTQNQSNTDTLNETDRFEDVKLDDVRLEIIQQDLRSAGIENKAFII